MPHPTCGPGSVLTGMDGMITMIPPGTQCCLLDKTDFPAPVAPATYSLIKVPATSDWRVGDPVVFQEKGLANLDSDLVPGTVYYIVIRQSTAVAVSATPDGVPIGLNNDGGTGGVDTPGPDSHIEMRYAEDKAMCHVPTVTLSITRGEIDNTAIPCKPSSANGAKFAKFRSYQPGYAEGTGTVTIRLTPDNASFNNRILQAAILNEQAGCVLKAYFNAVSTADGLSVDDEASTFAEFEICLMGLDGQISQDEGPTEINVNYRITRVPTHLFGANLS